MSRSFKSVEFLSPSPRFFETDPDIFEADLK